MLVVQETAQVSALPQRDAHLKDGTAEAMTTTRSPAPNLEPASALVPAARAPVPVLAVVQALLRLPVPPETA